MQDIIKNIGVIGAGIMGIGIVQIAIQANYHVYLYDAQHESAKNACEKLNVTLNRLVEKNKISPSELRQALSNLHIVENIQELQVCDLIIEAVIEKLDIKQALMKQLEQIVTAQCILASNTSSLSITEIAAQCQHPERVAGYHFFNPVPLMKVVEVIQGLHTHVEITQQLAHLARSMGHCPVLTKDTPGFIINHAGRAYGTEALKILSENVTSVPEIDLILKKSLGFKMGPFELLDLTGLDVSHPVMSSIYNQYYQEPRYRPNVLTQRMLIGKKLGRKTGEGFYQYHDQVQQEIPIFRKYAAKYHPLKAVWLSTDFEDDFEELSVYLNQKNIQINPNPQPDTDDLIIVANYGDDATHSALRLGINPEQLVCIDMLGNFEQCRILMPSLITKPEMIEVALYIFSQPNCETMVIEESLGFVSQRILAMVVNLACDMAQQKIATVEDINIAVKLGLGYPLGPIEWGDSVGKDKILLILDRISRISQDPRYRPSPWLQRRCKLNLPLIHSQ